jgi:GDPmannose 4,6-dehydratase
MSRALVIGAHGQDGALLTSFLTAREWEVDGIGKEDLDIGRFDLVKAVLSRSYQHIFYLAAFHHSSQDSVVLSDRELYEKSCEVHVTGLINVLEGVRSVSPASRIFYAASSLVFGTPAQEPQNEDTPFAPLCIYGITKTSGIQLCRFYRKKHGVFACSGILFNHESPLRQRKFVIPKIINSAIAISRGSPEKLQLGDLSARVDWGYAPDYVDAMHRILCLDQPEDFVIATGESHSVQEVVEIVFTALGLDWRDHVLESPFILTRQRTALRGDIAKLQKATAWKPSVDFKQMILRLLKTARHV